MGLLLKRPSEVQPVFCCPVCGTFWTTDQEAMTCARSLPISKQIPGIKPGDVVIVRQGYTWYNREEWIAGKIPGDPSARSHFDRADTYEFYYVVTALHRDTYYDRPFSDCRGNHRAKASMISGAIIKTEHVLDKDCVVWTAPKTHRAFQLAPNQEKLQHLVEQVRHLIGIESHHLM